MRKISLLCAFAAAVSILLCAGCQNPQSDSGTAAPSDSGKAASGSASAASPTGSASGASTGNLSGKLTVCADSSTESIVSGLIDAYRRLNPDVDISMSVLSYGSGSSEARVTELRTEIMSGGGPDVFILSCMPPNIAEDYTFLFSDPQKIMEAEVFLPLDTYMEKAQYMRPEAWNAQVLAAGQTEEGQLLLPLSYVYYAHAFRSEDLAEKSQVPASWDALMACKDPVIRQSVARVIFMEYGNAFGAVADYGKESLLLEKEALQSVLEAAVSFGQAAREGEAAAEAVAGGRVDDSFISSLMMYSKADHVIMPVYNVNGAITANVTSYAGISRFTESPEAAFGLLDLLFSDDILCSGSFNIEDRSITVGPISDLSVHNDALSARYPHLSQADQEALMKLDKQIGSVRFFSDMDKALTDLYYQSEGPGTESELAPLVERALEDMQMRLSE